MEFCDIKIKKKGRISQSKQVADTLRESIKEGDIKINQFLPGERTLAKKLGVSRDVVRRAYGILREERVIELYSLHKGFRAVSENDD